jgi:carbon storage regulator
MLVLSRKIGEKIIINDNIEVTVVDIKGNTIRLGIVAPKDIPIARGELIESKNERNSSQPQQKEADPSPGMVNQ